jgi:hypothetical protein
LAASLSLRSPSVPGQHWPGLQAMAPIKPAPGFANASGGFARILGNGVAG